MPIKETEKAKKKSLKRKSSRRKNQDKLSQISLTENYEYQMNFNIFKYFTDCIYKYGEY